MRIFLITIIARCLRNNPSERFQSIDEIIKFYSSEKNKKKEIDPFDDMYLFHDAILSIFPEFYNHAYVITKKEDMCKLFNSIFSHKYNNSIEFNTGKTNSS